MGGPPQMGRASADAPPSMGGPPGSRTPGAPPAMMGAPPPMMGAPRRDASSAERASDGRASRRWEAARRRGGRRRPRLRWGRCASAPPPSGSGRSPAADDGRPPPPMMGGRTDGRPRRVRRPAAADGPRPWPEAPARPPGPGMGQFGSPPPGQGNINSPPPPGGVSYPGALRRRHGARSPKRGNRRFADAPHTRRCSWGAGPRPGGDQGVDPATFPRPGDDVRQPEQRHTHTHTHTRLTCGARARKHSTQAAATTIPVGCVVRPLIPGENGPDGRQRAPRAPVRCRPHRTYIVRSCSSSTAGGALGGNGASSRTRCRWSTRHARRQRRARRARAPHGRAHDGMTFQASQGLAHPMPPTYFFRLTMTAVVRRVAREDDLEDHKDGGADAERHARPALTYYSTPGPSTR